MKKILFLLVLSCPYLLMGQIDLTGTTTYDGSYVTGNFNGTNQGWSFKIVPNSFDAGTNFYHGKDQTGTSGFGDPFAKTVFVVRQSNKWVIQSANASPYGTTYTQLYITQNTDSGTNPPTNVNWIKSTDNSIVVLQFGGLYDNINLVSSELSSLCSTSSSKVNFSPSGINAGNVYTIELSDNTGAFPSSPTIIGTLNSSTVTSIPYTIPTGTTSGYTYKLKIKSSNPVSEQIVNYYSGSSSLSIGYSLPVISKNPITPIIEGSGTSVVLTASGCNGDGTLLWTNDLGTNASITVSPTATTYYYVSCTISGCTNYQGYTSVTVNPLPNLTASVGSICMGNSTTLSVTNCYSGTVSWNNGLANGTIQVVSPTTPTTYTATCSITGLSKSILINVFNTPIAPALTKSINTPIEAGTAITLTATGCDSPNNLVWDDNTSTNPRIVNPENTTIYSASCNNSLTCFSAISTINVAVNLPTCPLTPINVDNIPSVILNGVSYFAKSDPQTGIELWKGDANGNNAVLLKDINTTTTGGSSMPFNLFTFNNHVYFIADDGLNGMALWKSDGVVNGTITLVTNDFPIQNTDYSYKRFVESNGYVMYASSQGLSKTDGTTSQLILQKKAFYPSNMTDINGTVFFSNFLDGSSSNELWKSDGTTAGTVLVKTFQYGYVENLFNSNGTLYFKAANAGGADWELWKSDGTTAGTVLVKDIVAGTSGSSPRPVITMNNILYFSANATNNSELWRTDGTSGGTYKIKDYIGPGPAILNNHLYFSSSNATNGSELWKTDGTIAGTVLVKDIYAGSTGSQPNSLTLFNNQIYFSANDGISGYDVWKTDGTAAGTVLVKDLPMGTNNVPYKFTKAPNYLYFTAYENNYTNNLWKTDGTTSGTTRVNSDIIVYIPNYNTLSFTVLNSNVYFPGKVTSSKIELFKTDGTSTQLVKDIRNSANSSKPAGFFTFNNEVFFNADDGSGNALWKTNGTANGTIKIHSVPSIYPSPGSRGMEVLNNTLYYLSNFANGKPYLYKTDGTPVGTSLVTGTNAPSGLTAKEIIKVGNILYLSATTSTAPNPNDYQLWKTDGTVSGLQIVKILGSEYGGWGQPGELTGVNGIVYFRANGSDSNIELWRSDGSPNGTYLVKDINISGYNGNLYYGSYPTRLINMNGILYFRADDKIHGGELWRSDGTESGTYMVKDINSNGATGGGVDNPTNYGGILYFTSDNGINGSELWKSDGTTDGTVMVKDINSGNASSDILNLNLSGGILTFVANDGVSGPELWKTDGTSIGTNLFIDTYPGTIGNFQNSYSHFPRKIGDKLFYNTFGPSNQNNWMLSNGNLPSSLNFSSNNNPSDDISSGFINKIATNKITATIKITGTANVTYQAKSIELNEGFKANNGVVFKAEVGGCN